MADEELIAHIHRLVDEEHEIRGRGEPDEERLEQIDVTLDQCWDLLRQRRAHRDAGQADTSDVRDERVVEGYQQ
jgi:hypothetical protein